MWKPIGQHTHQQIPAGKGATLTPQPGKIAFLAEPETPLHQPLVRFPVDLFDMVGCDRQDMAPTSATGLQNLTTISGLHPLTETMHTLATANFRLPSTLG
jgi:hypothetical protein